MTLPTFLVIGAQRAGTTLLHEVLDSHPEIFVPYRRKEVHYFDWYWDRGTRWYADFFPAEDEACRYRAIGEVTPDYLFEPAVPERIRKVCPHCRFIVSLRHPADRAYSSYLYARRSYNERRSFEEYIEQEPEVLHRGRYSEQLSRYLTGFGEESILILIFEEFLRAPADHLGRLSAFLGLSAEWPDPQTLLQKPVNDSRDPYFRRTFAYVRAVGNLLQRHDFDWPVRIAKRYGLVRLFGLRSGTEAMAETTRRRLDDFYRDELAAMERLLGRDVGAWRAREADSPETGGAEAPAQR